MPLRGARGVRARAHKDQSAADLVVVGLTAVTVARRPSARTPLAPRRGNCKIPLGPGELPIGIPDHLYRSFRHGHATGMHQAPRAWSREPSCVPISGPGGSDPLESKSRTQWKKLKKRDSHGDRHDRVARPAVPQPVPPPQVWSLPFSLPFSTDMGEQQAHEFRVSESLCTVHTQARLTDIF